MCISVLAVLGALLLAMAIAGASYWAYVRGRAPRTTGAADVQTTPQSIVQRVAQPPALRLTESMSCDGLAPSPRREARATSRPSPSVSFSTPNGAVFRLGRVPSPLHLEALDGGDDALAANAAARAQQGAAVPCSSAPSSPATCDGQCMPAFLLRPTTASPTASPVVSSEHLPSL